MLQEPNWSLQLLCGPLEEVAPGKGETVLILVGGGEVILMRVEIRSEQFPLEVGSPFTLVVLESPTLVRQYNNDEQAKEFAHKLESLISRRGLSRSSCGDILTRLRKELTH